MYWQLNIVLFYLYFLYFDLYSYYILCHRHGSHLQYEELRNKIIMTILMLANSLFHCIFLLIIIILFFFINYINNLNFFLFSIADLSFLHLLFCLSQSILSCCDAQPDL